jgi:hypothetical protein
MIKIKSASIIFGIMETASQIEECERLAYEQIFRWWKTL